MTLEERVRAALDAGDASGAATLALRELGPSILRYLRAVLRDEEDAADAFSIAAERIWSGLPGFRGGASLRTWTFRIAWNAALNLRDEAWRRKARPFRTGEASRLAEELRTRTAVRAERQRDAFERLRASLSDEEQSLLTLRIDQGLSWEEVAEVLSAEGTAASAGTLQKRFERLKERLAAKARDEGLVG